MVTWILTNSTLPCGQQCLVLPSWIHQQDKMVSVDLLKYNLQGRKRKSVWVCGVIEGAWREDYEGWEENGVSKRWEGKRHDGI